MATAIADICKRASSGLEAKKKGRLCHQVRLMRLADEATNIAKRRCRYEPGDSFQLSEYFHNPEGRSFDRS